MPEQLSVLRAGVLPSEASAGIGLFSHATSMRWRGAQSLHDIEHSAYFRIRFDAVYALELCSRTPDRLWRASGAHALFEGSSIQQKFRDLHAVSQHGGADIASALSDYGKFLLDPEGFLAKYSPPGSEVTTAALFR